MIGKNEQKGQFYIIGALVIILLMFYSKYSATVRVEEPIDTSKNIFSNIKNEYFNALDSAYSSRQTSQTIEDNITTFLDFLNNVSISHGQRFESLAVAFVPQGSNYNASVLNFIGENITVSVVLGNVSQTLSLTHKSSGRLVFNNTPEFVSTTVNYTRISSPSTERRNSFNISNRRLNGYVEMKMMTSKTTWSDVLTNTENVVV